MARQRWQALMVLLIGFSLLVPVGPAVAQDTGSPSADEAPVNDAPVQILLRPDGGLDAERMIVEAQPGQSQTLAVYIGNLGAEPLKVFTFTADISTRINGGLLIEQESEEQSEPTTWITYPTEEYTIDPGNEIRREFALQVPEGTAPGEYVVPIAVETVDAFSVPGTAALMQKIRKIITIYITIPGDMQSSFELGTPVAEYLDHRLVMDVPATNTGNTTLRLTGEMTIFGPDGSVMVDHDVVMGAFYQGDETRVRLTLGGVGLAPGEYAVSLSLTDSISGFSASIEQQAVQVPEPPSDELVPLAMENIVILPNAEPIQFASVVLDIVNNAEVIRNGRLVLVVEKDGQPLEEFALAENLTLEQGTTTVSQRYLPLDGWSSGEYSFGVRLEATDEGSTRVLLSQEDVATIEVP